VFAKAFVKRDFSEVLALLLVISNHINTERFNAGDLTTQEYTAKLDKTNELVEKLRRDHAIKEIPEEVMKQIAVTFLTCLSIYRP